MSTNDSPPPDEVGGQQAPIGGVGENAVPSPVSTTSPFQGEAAVLAANPAMRDEVSLTQSGAANAREISARHITRLLYSREDYAGSPAYHLRKTAAERNASR